MLPRPALALAALLAAGCAATPPAADPISMRTRPPSHVAPDHAAPLAVDEARQARLTAAVPEVARVLREGLQKTGVPNAAMGILTDNRLAYAEGFGRRTDQGGAVDADTVFRIGSITKVFTGLSMLLLRDEGRLGLDDPLSRWLPEIDECIYPTSDSPAITLRHLVTHTSGIPRLGALDYANDHGVTEAELLHAGKSAVLEFPPGTDTRYSNLAMALGGLAVSRAAGEPLRDLVTRRILGPLGMNSTTWDRERVTAGKLADGHSHPTGGAYQLAPVHWRLGVAEGMGGLYSSVADMAKFAGFELDAWPARSDPELGPVKRSTVRESQMVGGMVRPNRQSFGVNWVLVSDATLGFIVTHNGGTEGYSACLVLGPGRGIGVILLSSALDGIDDLVRRAFTLLAQAERGEAPRAERQPILRAAPQLDPAATAALARIAALLDQPDPAAISAAFAPEFFEHVPREEVLKLFTQVHEQMGACKPPVVTAARGPGVGGARIDCAKGAVNVDFRAQKDEPHLIEALRVTPAEAPPP